MPTTHTKPANTTTTKDHTMPASRTRTTKPAIANTKESTMPAIAATTDPTVIAEVNAAIDGLVSLAESINLYFHANATTDPAAPAAGKPFVHNDKVYLQLDGRGGAGKDDVAAPVGLRAWMIDNGVTIAPATLRRMLELLGYTRKPFGYTHPSRGASSASYYSRELDGSGVHNIAAKLSKRAVAA